MCKNNKDYCGPVVVNFKTWLLSWLVPDNLWGVYIGDICQIHDQDYSKGGSEADRNGADTRFSTLIEIRVYRKLAEAGDKKAWKKSLTAAKLYYIGVDLGGKEHFNYHD